MFWLNRIKLFLSLNSNLRSGPILAVLIQLITATAKSFRFALPEGVHVIILPYLQSETKIEPDLRLPKRR